MKEIKEIIASYDAAESAGKKTALATVVHVEGSSYRRAGARMIVTEDGLITGAISGGCLEGDALRKALLAIHQQKNKLVTYDTTDDDASIGVQLGCNGVVHILFEPLDTNNANNPVEILRRIHAQRARAVVATLFSFGLSGNQPGTVLARIGDNTLMSENDITSDMCDRLTADAAQTQQSGITRTTEYILNNESLQVSLQVVDPSISIVIFGAGNDAIPLMNLAAILGWEITVVDGRASHATRSRFGKADRIIVAKPLPATAQLQFDALSAAVLMTHNYNYDIKVLEQLLSSNCPYIGVLGPRKKMEKMYNELHEAGIQISTDQKQKVFSPVGLDLGAETSEEIALSIAAEIKAALSGAAASPLKKKPGPIHERSEPV
jgi:xanthine/CO dehydrogenase XdhC/CoxF family maturation factor